MFDTVQETGILTEDDAVLAPPPPIPRPLSDGQSYWGNGRGKMQSVNATIIIELMYLLCCECWGNVGSVGREGLFFCLTEAVSDIRPI